MIITFHLVRSCRKDFVLCRNGIGEYFYIVISQTFKLGSTFSCSNATCSFACFIFNSFCYLIFLIQDRVRHVRSSDCYLKSTIQCSLAFFILRKGWVKFKEFRPKFGLVYYLKKDPWKYCKIYVSTGCPLLTYLYDTGSKLTTLRSRGSFLCGF